MSSDGSTRSWWTRMFGTSSPEGDVGPTDPDAPRVPAVMSWQEERDGMRVALEELAEARARAESRAEADRLAAATLEREHERLLVENERLRERVAKDDELVANMRNAAEASERRRVEAEEKSAQLEARRSDAARRLEETQRALADRDKRLQSSVAEVTKLRLASTKANTAAKEREREAAGTIASLRTELAAVQSRLADAERRRTTDESSSGAIAKVAALEAELAEQAAALEKARGERDAARRLDHETRAEHVRRGELLDTAERALAAARARIADLDARARDNEAKAGAAAAREDMLRAFAATVLDVGAGSLRQCVGDRQALPLALAWRERQLADALVPHGADDAENAPSELVRHLSHLGVCAAEGRAEGRALVVDCTLEASTHEATHVHGVAAWLAHYMRAWLRAVYGREFTVAALSTSPERAAFSATFE